ncbi:MAG: AraC family transcriptional regulator [Chloroflexi bacterium]|nr:AraC family transcriptional regulator [Chloroflexota bacterium]
MHQETEKEHSIFRHVHGLGNLDLLRGTYVTHTFARHTHDTYAISTIERGIEGFVYRGTRYTAPTGSLVVLHPDEAHTGYAAHETGWSYRMFYPSLPLLQQVTTECIGQHPSLPFFPTPVIEDRHLARLLSGIHSALEASVPTLELEERLLSALLHLIVRHAKGSVIPRPAGNEHGAVQRVRAYLEANFALNVSLETLATLTGFSPFYLTRVFTREVGLPPHVYLRQVRVQRAKQLLSAGGSIAQVALETGFADQSHLTRHFLRVVGVTPGQYVRGIRT